MTFISLKRPRGTTNVNETGLATVDSVLPTYHPGPYTFEYLPHRMLPVARGCVPPLRFYALQALYPNFDCIDMLDTPRRPYHPDKDAIVFLIPTFSDHVSYSDMQFVDPRVWATLVQVYDFLPPAFGVYSIPLSDIYLMRLQTIQSSAHFTLITVLDLSGVNDLTDDTVCALGVLSNLAVLDLSSTTITTWAVKQLTMCVSDGREGPATGPARLRILSLRGCSKVTDQVKPTLGKFPLLSVVDLRGTSVRSTPFVGFLKIDEPEYQRLFFPSPCLLWIPTLMELFATAQLFDSDSPPHTLFINRLQHPDVPVRQSGQGISAGEQVAMLFPSGKQDVKSVREVLRSKRRYSVDFTEEIEEDVAHLYEGVIHHELAQQASENFTRDFYANKRSSHTSGPYQAWIAKSHLGSISYNDDHTLMFVRYPPAFSSHTGVCSQANGKAKQNAKGREAIMAKRTKLADESGVPARVEQTRMSVASAWLNVCGRVSKTALNSSISSPPPSDQSRTAPALPAASRPRSPHHTTVINSSAEIEASSISAGNPFRAKAKEHKKTLSHKLREKASSDSSKSPWSQITGVCKVARSQETKGPHSGFHDKARAATSENKVVAYAAKAKGFDMKAWAMSKSKGD